MGKLKRQMPQKKKIGLKKNTKSAGSNKKSTLSNKKGKEMKFSDKTKKETKFKLNKRTLRKEGIKRNGEKKEEDDEEEEQFDVAPEDLILSHLIPKDTGYDSSTEGGDINTRELVKIQNKKTKQKQSGGFQSMGLSYPVYKGVIRKGYKVPTPIQRKTIPLIMDGKDVVGMARTGSGKTGAFLIPMLEKLNCHSSDAVRAVILSPTRELALQTLKFTHELGKFTDLKSSLIVGGDNIENQFATLHQNPDILIATPGRFLHLLVEMEIKQLEAVEYIVFDEADRLFEMGFAEQLREIMQRLPQSRQTVLFSATLPKVLVDFAMAGLSDPTLIRLDVDTKISEKLKTGFIFVRDEDKTALLLHMLQKSVKTEELTVVFVSTRHHVDYLYELLTFASLPCSYIYSSLDQVARKLNLSKFRSKATKILIVTDIAARGIDVPLLDNVINFDFPPRPKIFVHRVGRVARAGRFGHAYSFVTKEEMPYLLDLHLFLGRPIKFANDSSETEEDGLFGNVPQGVIVSDSEFIKNISRTNFNLTAAHKVMTNGQKGYVRTREAGSVESSRRSKEINTSTLAIHPCFKNAVSETNEQLSKLLLDLKTFKPSLTVFESITTKKNKEAEHMMQLKRKQHGIIIEMEVQRQKDKPILVTTKKSAHSISDDNYIADSFNIKRKDYKDSNYIPHQSSDGHQEKGLSVTSFEKEAKSLSIELKKDESSEMRKDKADKKWDRKRKKFVGVDNPHAKKFKTESGNYIPSSYKSDRYKDWMKKTHFNQQNDNEGKEKEANRIQSHNRMNKFSQRNNSTRGSGGGGQNGSGSGGGGGGGKGKNVKGTLKSKDQIVGKRLKEDLMNKIRNNSKKNKGGKANDQNRNQKPNGKKQKRKTR